MLPLNSDGVVISREMRQTRKSLVSSLQVNYGGEKFTCVVMWNRMKRVVI